MRLLLQAIFLFFRKSVAYFPFDAITSMPGGLALNWSSYAEAPKFFYHLFIMFISKIYNTNPSIAPTTSRFLVVHSSNDGILFHKKLKKLNIQAQIAELPGLHACFLENKE